MTLHMNSLEATPKNSWTSTGHDSIPAKYQLSPSTRYYICKLLRQPISCESSELLAFRVKLSEDNCAQLNERLNKLYPDETDLTKAILRLENLIYFSQSISTQFSLYPEYVKQLNSIKLEVFQLLGFSPAVNA